MQGASAFDRDDAELTVKLLANFPDYEAAPRPDYADNARTSNPFGVAKNGRVLYVVDASFNNLRAVGIDSGVVAMFATFAPLDNPLPFGPPKIDPVPDNVRLFGDQLLVPTLTGFPVPLRRGERAASTRWRAGRRSSRAG